MNLTREQKRKIKEIGKKFNLKLILLHGSFASGKNKFGSDLDVAVLGKKPIEFEKLLKIHGDLADVFGDNQNRELDLKSLYKTDPLFCYQVAKTSQLLYGNITDYSEFRAYTFANFFDSQDLFRLEKRLIDKFQNYLNRKYKYA
ncbi:nucleotidyltransferase domain-containing protein [Patescibacteria group bacterium]|nr:nucleotidyltransferase domain-containing protein [Patescibacteria group bacterium]